MFAVFNEHGVPTAFYTSEIHAHIPEKAVEITDEQWREFIDNPCIKAYKNGEVVDYKLPEEKLEPVNVISDRQFIQALAEAPYKIITWDEAYAWGGRGELPAILKQKLDAITDDDTRKRGYMLLVSAKTYELNHPVTAMLAASMGWTKEQLATLWTFASTL